MRYMLSKEFTKISETSGTIQNASQIRTIEMSTSNAAGSGILINPLQKHTFSNLSNVYLRCVDGQCAACVVPFFVDIGSAVVTVYEGDGGGSSDSFTQADVDDMFKP